MPTFDVIVVGGGVAGLTAAGALSRAGKRVLLLEARERLGGRVCTERRRGWDGPIELGAEFVHAGNAEFWRFLKRHRLGTKHVPPRHWLFRDGELTRIKNLERAIERVTDAIDGERMRGWSFAEFMAGRATGFTPEERNLAMGFVEGFQAASPQRMSVAVLEGETLDDAEQFVLTRGYDRVVAVLAAELRDVQVVCGAAVTAVRWKRGDVTVRAGGRAYVGRAAMITLPIGVWQAKARQRGAVQFTPALREKNRIAAKIGVGQVLRLQLRFDARRWRALLPDPLRGASRGGFGFVHSRLEGVPVWWALGSAPILTGWAGGPVAIRLMRKSRRGIRDTALASLATILGVSGVKLRGALRDWSCHDWARDPFSRGAYSFIAAGGEDAAEKLRVPMQGTLFFAGEATADGAEVGTVHGAFASGLRAAREVRKALSGG